MTLTERRILNTTDLQVRAVSDEDRGPLIWGMGIVYSSPSLDLGGFREFVAPGAAKRSLRAKDDIRAYFNHDPSKPLGSRVAGNLKLTDSAEGLAYEIEPPDTTYAADLMAAMKAGLVRGSSFSFAVRKDKWESDEAGVQTRTLLEIDLFEIGPVTQPAYPDSTAQVRSLLAEHGLELDGDTVRAKPVLSPIEEAAGVTFAELAEYLRQHRAGDLAAGVFYRDALAKIAALAPAPAAVGVPLALRRRQLELMRLRA